MNQKSSRHREEEVTFSTGCSGGIGRALAMKTRNFVISILADAMLCAAPQAGRLSISP
jgi:hypothetical protein